MGVSERERRCLDTPAERSGKRKKKEKRTPPGGEGPRYVWWPSLHPSAPGGASPRTAAHKGGNALDGEREAGAVSVTHRQRRLGEQLRHLLRRRVPPAAGNGRKRRESERGRAKSQAGNGSWGGCPGERRAFLAEGAADAYLARPEFRREGDVAGTCGRRRCGERFFLYFL